MIASYGGAHPALYVYSGDFNDVDTSVRITNLLDASVGLVLFTPVDPNNGSCATINSDPAKSTYLDRRINYLLLRQPCSHRDHRKSAEHLELRAAQHPFPAPAIGYGVGFRSSADLCHF